MLRDNVRPGTPLCDKAQFSCSCQVWSSIPSRVAHSVSVNVMLDDVFCSPTYASSEALLNFTVLCYGLVIINTASSGKGKWHIHTNRSKQDLQTAESWFLPHNSPVAMFWTWTCTIKVMLVFCLFLSETILDKSLFGKLKLFQYIYKYKEVDLNNVKIVTQGNSRNIKLAPISCSPQLTLPWKKSRQRHHSTGLG